MEIDTSISVIVVSLTIWEAHHSPRASPSGCVELPRSLMGQQWPQYWYQFLWLPINALYDCFWHLSTHTRKNNWLYIYSIQSSIAITYSKLNDWRWVYSCNFHILRITFKEKNHSGDMTSSFSVDMTFILHDFISLQLQSHIQNWTIGGEFTAVIFIFYELLSKKRTIVVIWHLHSVLIWHSFFMTSLKTIYLWTQAWHCFYKNIVSGARMGLIVPTFVV